MIPKIKVTALLTFLVALLAPPCLGAQADPNKWSKEIHIDTKAQALEQTENIARARWARAREQILVAPHLPLHQEMQSHLVVLNRFHETIGVQIELLTEASGRQPLLAMQLQPREVFSKDLSQLPGGENDSTAYGTLLLRYTGDSEMIQGWLTLTKEEAAMELPLINAGEQAGQSHFAYWDLRNFRSDQVQPKLLFHNLMPTPASISMKVRTSRGVRTRIFRIRGFSTLNPELPKIEKGSLEISHGGNPNRLVTTHFLEGPNFLAQLPRAPKTALPTDSQVNSVQLSGLVANNNDIVLNLQILDTRSTGTRRVTRVHLVNPDGRPTEIANFETEPGEVRSVSLPNSALPTAIGSLLDHRVRVSTQEKGLHAYAFARTGEGQIFDVPLIPSALAHSSGTYPIPNLREHQVVTSFSNLGDEPAQIFAQLTTDRGDFVLDPFVIPSQGAFQLDFNRFAGTRPADSRGRFFPDDFTNAFFQWFSRRGSKNLIARTQVWDATTGDAHGFNCVECCSQVPWGEVEDGPLAVIIGRNFPFTAHEYISTCSGQMGPYYAYPDSLSYSSPASWSGQSVTASGTTHQDVSFSASGEFVRFDCYTGTTTFTGMGEIIANFDCQNKHNPDYNPAQGCALQFGTGTPECETCCKKQQKVAECTCDLLPALSGVCKSLAKLLVLDACLKLCNAPS